MNAEQKRLVEAREHTVHWRRWGPYLSQRQWGTVREDYSPNGTAWEYFPHDHARSRAYRWGEDGILGISDNHQRLCFALTLWNGKDPILKERFFGLSGNEGNHGEDVKDYYFFLDNIPSHAYMKGLYKYPQAAFPYRQLVEENRRRNRRQSEYELIDTGVFDDNRYFDVFVEYAKASAEDLCIRITAVNRGPETAHLDLLPTLWFRNTWSWANDAIKPTLKFMALPVSGEGPRGIACIRADHPELNTYWLYAEAPRELLFTENETNFARLFGTPTRTPYVKDGFHEYLVQRNHGAINRDQKGTKAAARYSMDIPAGGSSVLKLRLTTSGTLDQPLGEFFDRTFVDRQRETDEFYDQQTPKTLSEDERRLQRQAFAGMLWSKQFYQYVVHTWLHGDPAQPVPPPERLNGRNKAWEHVYSDDILSMPDTWEYPWFASWDLAFHTLPLAMIDPDFAKQQLERLTREWYMHPNGQIPAYEWAFGDVNPPVQAWAALRVFKIDRKMTGQPDFQFLERVFQKLLLNFTWWVNRKDTDGKNIFEGGFLGLDNIGIFDRSKPLPTGGHLEQSDGTSWMGMYCLNMLGIALTLAPQNPVYEDIASKFFEHFLFIAEAINDRAGGGEGLWDEEEGFYFDVLHLPSGERKPLRIRSLVGVIPLFAVETLDPVTLEKLPAFRSRFEWFLKHRLDLHEHVACMTACGHQERRLLSIVDEEKLRKILKRLLNESEFLSPYGIRSLSRDHAEHPYVLSLEGHDFCIDYEPAESTAYLFGGNSNWRGPVWFPMNFLIIESLQKFHHVLGPTFKVECPTGSGRWLSLWEVADELSRRLIRLFQKDAQGRRPVFGGTEKFQTDPEWRDYLLFFEYFHGDNGAGIGASHQTGWTGLVAKLIQQQGEQRQKQALGAVKTVSPG